MTQKYYIISDRDRELLHCDVTNPKDAGKLVSEGEMENFIHFMYISTRLRSGVVLKKYLKCYASIDIKNLSTNKWWTWSLSRTQNKKMTVRWCTLPMLSGCYNVVFRFTSANLVYILSYLHSFIKFIFNCAVLMNWQILSVVICYTQKNMYIS